MRMGIFKYVVMVCVAGGLLASCSTLDLPNAYRLKKTDPQDMSPEHGRVAVIWPKDINSDSFTFDFTFDGGDGSEPQKEVFTLSVDDGARPLIKRPKGNNLGVLTVYSLPAQEQARAEAFKKALIERLFSLKTSYETSCF